MFIKLYFNCSFLFELCFFFQLEISSITFDSFLDVSAIEEIATSKPQPNTSTPVRSRQSHLCAECGKSYTSFSSYRIHIRKVHGLGKAAPYSCPECDKCYFKKQHFEAHVRSHNRVKPFKCPECKTEYATEKNLKSHNCKPKQFVCPICEKAFQTKKYLNEHSLQHLKDPIYPCNTCGKRFKYRANLSRHEKQCPVSKF